MSTLGPTTASILSSDKADPDFWETMNALRRTGTLCDIQLCVPATDISLPAQVFPAHKVVLVASSQYFRKCLHDNELLDVFNFDGITGENLQLVLDYIYHCISWQALHANLEARSAARILQIVRHDAPTVSKRRVVLSRDELDMILSHHRAGAKQLHPVPATERSDLAAHQRDEIVTFSSPFLSGAGVVQAADAQNAETYTQHQQVVQGERLQLKVEAEDEVSGTVQQPQPEELRLVLNDAGPSKGMVWNLLTENERSAAKRVVSAAAEATPPCAVKTCAPSDEISTSISVATPQASAFADLKTRASEDELAPKAAEIHLPSNSTESSSEAPHGIATSLAGRLEGKRHSPVSSLTAPASYKEADIEDAPTAQGVPTKGSSAIGDKTWTAAASTAASTPRRSRRKGWGPAMSAELIAQKETKATICEVERKPPEETGRRMSRRSGGRSPARYSQEDWVLGKPSKVKRELEDRKEDSRAGGSNKQKQVRRSKEQLQDQSSETEDFIGTNPVETESVTGEENSTKQEPDAKPQHDVQSSELATSDTQTKDCSGETCLPVEENAVLKQVQNQDASHKEDTAATADPCGVQGVAAIKSEPEKGYGIVNFPGQHHRVAHGVPVSRDPVDPVSGQSKGYLKCAECDKLFKNTTGLNIHMQWQHSKLEPVRAGWSEHKCEHCDKVLKSFQALLCHERRIHGAFRSFSCDHCNQTFDSNKKLKRHLLDAHDMGHIICDACGEKFRTREGHRIHMFKQHSQDPPKEMCDTCGKVFKREAELRYHIRYTHSDVRRHTCMLCSHSFKTSTSLRRHLRTYHSDIREHQCDLCDAYFKTASDRNTHRRKHLREDSPLPTVRRLPRQTSFSCTECGKVFKRKAHCQLHHKMQHVDKMSGIVYKCGACSKDFQHKSYLMAHINQCHAPKRFSCSKCLKEFTHSYMLRKHQSLGRCKGYPITNNPFKCGRCGMTFTLKGNLTKHLADPKRCRIKNQQLEYMVIVQEKDGNVDSHQVLQVAALREEEAQAVEVTQSILGSNDPEPTTVPQEAVPTSLQNVEPVTFTIEEAEPDTVPEGIMTGQISCTVDEAGNSVIFVSEDGVPISATDLPPEMQQRIATEISEGHFQPAKMDYITKPVVEVAEVEEGTRADGAGAGAGAGEEVLFHIISPDADMEQEVETEVQG